MILLSITSAKITGGFRWVISILKSLTWKCKPHFSTRNFSSTFASIGDEWRAESSSRVAVKCGVGGAKYQFPKSNQLTWKCKPHFSTWNFSSTFATIGDEWRAESSSRVAVKCGVGGAKYQFPKSNQLTFKFYVGNYINNF